MMQTFLTALKNKLLLAGFTQNEVNAIIVDYQEMIDQAIKQGLKEEAIEDTFGSVEQIVAEIKQNSTTKAFEDIGQLINRYDKKLIQNIDIDLVNEDVKVMTHEESYFKLTYDGIFDHNFVSVEVSNETLIIKNNKKYQGLKKDRHKLSFYLYVPKDVRLNQVAVGSINGELNLQQISGNQLKVYNVNGLSKLYNNEFLEIKFDGVNATCFINNNFSDVLNAKTVSGNLELIENDTTETLSVTTVSAKINIQHTMIQHLKVNTVSGHIQCNEVYPEKLYFHSISGHITFENNDTSKEIKIENKRTMSGKVIIK